MARRDPASYEAASRLIADNLDLDTELGEDNEPNDDVELEADADLGPDDEEAPVDEQLQEEEEQLEDFSIREPEAEPAPLQTRQQQTPKKRTDGTHFDKKGNVVETKTGKVVAPAGPAARFYQDAYKAKQEVVSHKAQITQLQADSRSRIDRAVSIGEQLYTQNEQLKSKVTELTSVGTRLGINEAEQLDALQLAAEIKRDPKAGLQKLLTRAAANGIDISTLGFNGAAGMAPLMQAVRDEIGKLTTPITDAQKANTERARAQQESDARLQRSEDNVRRYFEERPEHQKFAPIYLQILQQPQFAKMSLGEIGARIEMNLLRQRYEGNGGSPQRQTNPATRRSIPNGRGGPQPNGQATEEMASPNSSWDDILKPIVAQHYRA